MTKQKSIDMLEPANETKKCFVIAPFGEDGTPTRKNFQQLLDYVIEPVANSFEYKVINSLDINEPGNITNQILKHLYEDDLVIADLTDHNPNVFYELAVRHCKKKPVIHIIENGQKIPFHVASDRTIFINRSDWGSLFDCKEQLKQQIISIEKNPDSIDNPIFRDFDFPLNNNLSKEISNTEVLAYLQDLSLSIKEIQTQLKQKESTNPASNIQNLGLVGLVSANQKRINNDLNWHNAIPGAVASST